MSLIKIWTILTILILILIFRIYLFYQTRVLIPDGGNVVLSVTLLEDPKSLGVLQRFNVDKNGERFHVRVSRFPQFYYGQTLKISGKVEDVVLEDGKIIRTIQFPHIEASDNKLLKPLRWIRNNLILFFSSALDSASSGLFLGIVFGIRDQIPQELLNTLSKVGVIHITAASGMNVTIFAGAVLFGLAKVMKKQKAIVVSFFVVWSYAFLSGFDASIVRASIMATISFGAGIIGRQNTSIWALAITGFLMLIISPTLIQSTGFQLSFAATFGIIFFGAKGAEISMTRGSRIKGVKNIVFSDFKTSIAAQVATLPILLGAFGQVSILSIIANVLILWTIPILMVIGSIGALVCFIIPQVGKLIILLSLPLLKYIQAVVEFLGSFDSVIVVRDLSWAMGIGYYFIVASILVFMRNIKKHKIIRSK